MSWPLVAILLLALLLQILHVSGLMESVTREQLRELFSQAGEVTKVDIPDGGRSMVSRMFVFMFRLLGVTGNAMVLPVLLASS
jgi:hypothetical protein